MTLQPIGLMRTHPYSVLTEPLHMRIFSYLTNDELKQMALNVNQLWRKCAALTIWMRCEKDFAKASLELLNDRCVITFLDHYAPRIDPSTVDIRGLCECAIFAAGEKGQVAAILKAATYSLPAVYELFLTDASAFFGKLPKFLAAEAEAEALARWYEGLSPRHATQFQLAALSILDILKGLYPAETRPRAFVRLLLKMKLGDRPTEARQAIRELLDDGRINDAIGLANLQGDWMRVMKGCVKIGHVATLVFQLCNLKHWEEAEEFALGAAIPRLLAYVQVRKQEEILAHRPWTPPIAVPSGKEEEVSYPPAQSLVKLKVDRTMEAIKGLCEQRQWAAAEHLAMESGVPGALNYVHELSFADFQNRVAEKESKKLGKTDSIGGQSQDEEWMNEIEYPPSEEEYGTEEEGDLP